MPEEENSCTAWKKLVGDFECCSSCHYEWEDGYGYLAEHEHEGKTYFTCCIAPGEE